MLGKVIGWFGRKTVLYIALILAIFGYALWTSGDVQRIWQRSQNLNQQQARDLERIIKEAEGHQRNLETRLKYEGESARKDGVEELDRKISGTQREIARLNSKKPDTLSTGLSMATLDMDALQREQMRQINLAFLERKLKGLKHAKDAAEKVSNRESTHRDAVDKRKSCNDAKAAVLAFDHSWKATIDRLPFRNRRAPLVKDRNKKCNDAEGAKKKFGGARLAASKALSLSQAWVKNDLPDTTKDLKNRLVEERESAQDTISARADWAWTHYEGEMILKRALVALILIIASPFLIRIFAWFVLAPLAMRRTSIRLSVPDGRGTAIAPAAPSRSSVTVRLQEGEELLVRQDYLQTTSEMSVHDHRWLLDWKKPLTSIATGLTFLTRVRGQGNATSISATREGLAEVTLLELPEGGACVLQPRALAAVVQPIKRPMRITSHWRLGSLNAWLTFQLRYLVFHGPSRLILKGGRGVRVEPAAQGRVFGQDQLVGFSANLAYSVARTETFWPYFLGRQQLLKDRVMAGDGVLIVEEAPSTVHRGEVRRGLEGMIDAGMKAFGM